MKLSALVLFLLYLPLMLRSQIILTEVMVDPIGSESTDEYVELFNTGSETVDLRHWQIGEGSGLDELLSVRDSTRLAPGQYALVLDPDYLADSARVYDRLIPPDALLLTLSGSTFGSGGFSNSRSEAIVLLNPLGDTLQLFVYPVGSAPGHSLEKVDFSAANGGGNWASSRDLFGTPGSLNSRTPAATDIALSSLKLSKAIPREGETVDLHARLFNPGLSTLNRIHWQMSLFDEGEYLSGDSGVVDLQIPAGDSLSLDLPILLTRAGQLTVVGEFSSPGDLRPENNQQTLAFRVDYGPGLRLIFNEILANPRSGQAEWVELLNADIREVDLSAIRFADAGDTVALSPAMTLLRPGEFRVISGNPDLPLQYSLDQALFLPVSGFPALNNGGDYLSLLGWGEVVYDRLGYTDLWYGRESEAGTSLEKINPGLNGADPASWAASVAGGGSTPGYENSLFSEVPVTETAVTISPNPFSPDGDGQEDFAVLAYQLPVESALLNARIYDLRGREIRLLANALPVSSRGTLVWDGKEDDGRMSRIGAYLVRVLARDNRQQNVFAHQTTVVLVKK